MFISLGVNLVATLFVVAQTWSFFLRTFSIKLNERFREYTQAVRDSPTSRKSNVFEILSLLVECGFCLCSIQVCFSPLLVNPIADRENF